MNIALRLAAVPVIALALAGCTAVTDAAPSPEPTAVVTPYTPAPEPTQEPLADVEVALATQVRNAAIDDLNRMSDRTIVDMSWGICSMFDSGLTAIEVEDALRQSRFNDVMLIAFMEPSVTALCPEHLGELAGDAG